jgi:hypothetical protein
MQQLADIHAAFTQVVLVCRRGVGAGEANARLDARRNAIVSGDEGERRRRPRWGDRDRPATELREGNVEALFQAQRLGVEPERSILVGNRDTDRRNPGDGSLRCVHDVLQSDCL